MKFINPAVTFTRLRLLFLQLRYGVKSFIPSRILNSLPPHPQWAFIQEMKKYSNAKEQ